jgi:phosphate transport system permease protein
MPTTNATDSRTLAAGRVRTGARHLGRRIRWADLLFRGATAACAGAVLLLLVLLAVFMVHGSLPALAAHGWRFAVDRMWDPTGNRYGALSFIYGTLYTSLIALFIALPLGIMTAVFLVEIAPRRVRAPVALAVEMLAAIPSVLFGLWGIFVLVPRLRWLEAHVLGKYFGRLPLFSGPPIGIGYLAAGVLLAIMILPLIVSVTREVILQVPQIQREAAYALGATRWEVIRIAVLPYGWRGIFGAGMLGLARALGETMAVTMVIGNSPQIQASLFAPGYTLAAVIANEFAEAPTPLAISSLISLGLILFLLSILVNFSAQVILRLLGRRYGSIAR